MKAMGFDMAEYGGAGGATHYDDPELEALNKQLMGGGGGDDLDENAMLAGLDDELGISQKEIWQEDCKAKEAEIAA